MCINVGYFIMFYYCPCCLFWKYQAHIHVTLNRPLFLTSNIRCYRKIYVLMKATQTLNLIKYRMQFIMIYNF